jgi:uncharacterized integral membrane protein
MHKAKVILTLLLVSAAAVFIMQNVQAVEVDFLFWHLMVSRVVLMAGMLTIGFIAGILMCGFWTRSKESDDAEA